jgi:4-amino-4-deoxy-L-arabinose transferase-like glycosyltransferase
MKDKTKFLPLLGVYIFIVLLASSNDFQGDQKDYIWFAQNLSHGYYSPPGEINLWFGPGYPIVLLPFVLLKLPWLLARLANPIFLFLAFLFFNATLRFYVKERMALIFTYVLALYPPFLGHIHWLDPEKLAIFLVCAFLFFFCKTQHNKRPYWPSLLAASVSLGYLALTKVFFGYVIFSGFILFLFLFLWKRKDTLKKAFLVHSFALIFCLPYLSYTYSLTGKFFYWGNSGGLSLYWMSSPYPNELGSWQSVQQVFKMPELSRNHGEFFDKLSKLSTIQTRHLKNKQFITLFITPEAISGIGWRTWDAWFLIILILLPLRSYQHIFI